MGSCHKSHNDPRSISLPLEQMNLWTPEWTLVTHAHSKFSARKLRNLCLCWDFNSPDSLMHIEIPNPWTHQHKTWMGCFIGVWISQFGVQMLNVWEFGIRHRIRIILILFLFHDFLKKNLWLFMFSTDWHLRNMESKSCMKWADLTRCCCISFPWHHWKIGVCHTFSK